MIALWPAIDLMGGKVVRLLHGDPSQRTVYPERAVEVAIRFASEGADGIHVVDLDAAFGTGGNAGPISEIIAASPVPVEVGGGLRNRDAIEAALASPVSRLVLGSLPFRAPALFEELLRAHAERLVVALDCKEGRPTIHGWVEDAGAGDAAGVARRFAALGVRTLLVTDVARDGAMTGPNLDLLASVRAVFPGEVLASGGMRGAEDLAPVAAVLAGGPAGAIFGRALHSGATTVVQLAAARAALREVVS
ncbi:MAG: 1-(5-phosphoribosyl)-5-[(5-phosphoribosylamino)methylideneamino] imidazole-4-carboxamide isomerase [Holophagales bacterium]|nr:1-(5-phosphoribosyl)-5-[(5-phosphoribosylamino)methylideneamino] imidazole-4-carboxamide isomerase [Holophagales bacterium]